MSDKFCGNCGAKLPHAHKVVGAAIANVNAGDAKELCGLSVVKQSEKAVQFADINFEKDTFWVPKSALRVLPNGNVGVCLWFTIEHKGMRQYT